VIDALKSITAHSVDLIANKGSVPMLLPRGSFDYAQDDSEEKIKTFPRQYTFATCHL